MQWLWNIFKYKEVGILVMHQNLGVSDMRQMLLVQNIHFLDTLFYFILIFFFKNTKYKLIAVQNKLRYCFLTIK